MCCRCEKPDAMQTNFPSPPSISTADDSTTGRSSGIDSSCMTKAALYARVSTDAQQKEGTIESQLVELRKQVAAAGHELVEEYIDDGYTGVVLDRPALNRMRGDRLGIFSPSARKAYARYARRAYRSERHS